MEPERVIDADLTPDGAAMSEDAALQELRAAGAFSEGHFILSSGLRSSVYVQCALAMRDPARGARLCAGIAARARALLSERPEIDRS